MRNLQPTDTRELRYFGLGLAALIALLFGVIGPWSFDRILPLWPFVAGGAIALAAALLPRAIYPLHLAWMPLGRVLGWLNTRLVLGIVYFLILLPFGLFARWAGKLHYRTGFEPAAETYRIRRKAEEKATDLEKPF